ncbi:hypothetical protein V6N11_039643 [Hibiscus sabdariffa]|uniref:Uncharacterized protein n=1 Tax=Hibiscus sabdariffa TaxID=183260 RepID=A0ABR2SP32_9ROSI
MGILCLDVVPNSIVNPKAAESLSDPEEYPNLFEDWQLALTLESQAAETRGVYRPAAEYLQHADRSHMTHVEAFRNMPKGDEGSQEEAVVTMMQYSSMAMNLKKSGVGIMKEPRQPKSN